MPQTRSLLGRRVTYSEAKGDETTNILHELTYPPRAASFRDHIKNNAGIIKALVAHHLYLTPSSCHIDISDQSEWLCGSFNLCVPVSIQLQSQKSRRVLMRFPLPYKVAGPGKGDEKVRCEAATYAWLNQECPDIPTACLHGFGLSTGQRFTAIRNASLWTRCLEYLKRWILCLFRCPVPCQYMTHPTSAPDELGLSYLLLDYIEDRQMLSQSYAEKSHDTTLRSNLFSDLAKIQLNLFRKPLPHISSLTINNDGVLSLNNQPLTLEICQFENEGIPIEMPQRTTTYSTVDTYIHDLLSLHDDRLHYQPNGASNMQDCLSQMSALSTLRTVYHEFFDRKLQSDPFVLTLTDLHPSNLFVDDDWHITRLVDLEFACIRPIEMQHPPYWLTSQAVDRIDEDQYSKVCNDFINVFEKEERKMLKEKHLKMVRNDLSYTELLKRLWRQGTFWYCLALDSPTGLHHIFYNRIRPRFQIPYEEPKEFDGAFYIAAATFWSSQVWDFVASKDEDKKKYDEQLLDAFQEHSL